MGDFDYSCEDTDPRATPIVADDDDVDAFEHDFTHMAQTKAGIVRSAELSYSSHSIVFTEEYITSYEPTVVNRQWLLSETDLEFINTGCYILGTGGRRQTLSALPPPEGDVPRGGHASGYFALGHQGRRRGGPRRGKWVAAGLDREALRRRVCPSYATFTAVSVTNTSLVGSSSRSGSSTHSSTRARPFDPPRDRRQQRPAVCG